MKVYITDLEAYNEGHLVGAWITLPMDTNELAEAIEDVLYRGRNACKHENHHEEFFITDWECDFMNIDEYDGIDRLNDMAEVVSYYDENDFLKLKFLVQEGYKVETIILDENIKSFDVDIYDYSSDTSFTDVYELLAYDMVEEGLFGSIPANFVNYIDYSAIGRDLSMDYAEFEHGILGRVA